MATAIKKFTAGDVGDDIARLHDVLREEGFDVSPTEVKRKLFGPSTRAAVAGYQKKSGVPVTGDIDVSVVPALSDSGNMPASENKPASDAPVYNNRVAGPAISGGFQPIIYGDKSLPVSVLQKALAALGYPISNEEVAQSLFANSTCKAVTAFKEKYKINSYPCLVEQTTASALNEMVREAGSTVQVVSPLVFGMSSSMVASLQEALQLLGFAKIDPNERGTFGESTCKAVLTFQKRRELKIMACYVDAITADKLKGLLQDAPQQPAEPEPIFSDTVYKVSGRVLDGNGQPMAKQKIVAYDVDLVGAGYYKTVETLTAIQSKGGMERLGETFSDKNGEYTILFTEKEYWRLEVNLADVVVYAVKEEKIIGLSALASKKNYTNGIEIRSWDVTARSTTERGMCEYERVMQIVQPFVTKSNMTLAQLSGSIDQIIFISNELDLPLGHVEVAVNAEKLAGESDGIRNDLLYCLGRQGVLLEWSSISGLSTPAIVDLINQSVKANIICAVDGKIVLDFATRVQTKSTEALLKSDHPVKSKVKAALGISLKSEALSLKFLKAYSDRKSSPVEFWKEMRNDPELKDKVDDILLTNRLSVLTGNHVSLVERLQPLVINRDMAQMFSITKAKWNELIGDDIPEFANGSTTDEKRSWYIAHMQSLLCAAFPNQKIAHMIANKELIAEKSDSIRDKLSAFMNAVSFDLGSSRWHDKVAGTDKRFEDKLNEMINEPERSEIRNELNKMQRVFKFSPTPEIMNKLLEKGIESASQVESIPFPTFKITYSDVADEETLLAIHQRACHVVSMIKYSLVTLHKFRQNTRVPAITGNHN